MIADNSWPVAPDIMRQIVIDNFDTTNGHEIEDYLDYLATYVALHAIQRLKLIVREVQKHGWRSKERILHHDDVGRNPGYAAHLCTVGAYFAAHSRVAAPLARNFERAQANFSGISEVEMTRLSSATKQ